MLEFDSFGPLVKKLDFKRVNEAEALMTNPKDAVYPNVRPKDALLPIIDHQTNHNQSNRRSVCHPFLRICTYISNSHFCNFFSSLFIAGAVLLV